METVHIFTPNSEMRQPVRLFRESLADLWAGRELSWRMFLRNLRGLYRQTALGIFWCFLPPLANTLVWMLLKRAGAIDLSEGISVSYPVYVVTGMVIWQSFVEALQTPMNAVSSNRSMLSKIRFPKESLLMVGIMEVLFNLAVRLVVLIPLILLSGIPFNGWLLAAPILILSVIALGLAIGLFLMPVGLLYQDVGKFLAVAIPVWMIVTPIVYQAPAGWDTNLLNWLNPASPLLTLVRDLMVFGKAEVWLSASVYLACCVPLLVAGLLYYRLSIPVLVERISG